MSRFEHRAVPIVMAAILIDTVGFGIVLPVLPELITSLGHMDLESATRVAGWLLAVFAVGQFATGPILGSLADRFGRRPVMMCAMAAFAIDYAVMAAAPSLLWLFVGRLVAGMAGAVIGPANAVVADVTTPERRSAAFGLLGAAFGIGFILGPALGGIAGAWGPRAPFWIASGCAAANALVMALFLPETLRPENRRAFRWRDANVIGAFRPLFETRAAASLIVAWFLWQLGGLVYPAVWSFWSAIRFGWGPGAIGWSLAYVGLLTILVQATLTDGLVARLGERRATLVGLSCGAGTMIVLSVSTAGWQVYALFLVGALAGIAYPAFTSLMSRRVDDTRQGSLQGGLAALNSVAAIAGPALFAQSLAAGAARGFDGSAFVLASGLIAAAALIIVWKVPSDRDAA